MSKILTPIVSGDRATVTRSALAPILMILVALLLAPGAFAQSAPDTSASDDSAADHSGWVRSDDVETDNSSPDQVLEVPQVAAPANSDGNDQAAPNGDSAPDQVGSVDDYQDEDDVNVSGIYIQQGGVNAYGYNPSLRNGRVNPAFGPFYPRSNSSSGPSMNRPGNNGMNTAIGSTSPMMPTPHSLSPMPGGWWNRAP